MKRDAKTDTANPKTCVICKTEISGNYAEGPGGVLCIPCWAEKMLNAKKHPLCADAHKNQDGTCPGYQRSAQDDEPCDKCKNCFQNEFYEGTEP